MTSSFYHVAFPIYGLDGAAKRRPPPACIKAPVGPISVTASPRPDSEVFRLRCRRRRDAVVPQLHPLPRPMLPPRLSGRRPLPHRHNPRRRRHRPLLGPRPPGPLPAPSRPHPRLRRQCHMAVVPLPPPPPPRRLRPLRPRPALLWRLRRARPGPIRVLPGQMRRGHHGGHRRAAIRNRRGELRRVCGLPDGGVVPGGGGAGGALLCWRVPRGARPRIGALRRVGRGAGGGDLAAPAAGEASAACSAVIRPAALPDAILLSPGLHTGGMASDLFCYLLLDI